MKIVVLCRNLRTAGGYVVGINFVRALRAVAPQHHFLVVVPPDVGYEEVALPDGSEMVVYRGGNNPLAQLRFDRFEVPRLIASFEPDCILALGNHGVHDSRIKQAVLFHKPQLVYPRKHYQREVLSARLRNWLLKRQVSACNRYTDLVFCQTPVSRQRFSDTFGYPIDQIEIMTNCFSEYARISREKAGVPERLQEAGWWNCLLLARFYGHKNIEVLVDVFREFRDELHDVRCFITVEASQHANVPAFLKAIEDHGLSQHIVNVGPLRQDELAGYFYGCDALLFPTTLESFSGTYLEAMSFGLPILTSDLDFARFVCGDAALYFDPWKPREIANQILALKGDGELSALLRKRGGERVTHFFKSWEEVTDGAIRRLEQLVEGDDGLAANRG